MNLIPALLGALILSAIAYFPRALGGHANFLFAMPVGWLIGYAISWIVDKTAGREAKVVSRTCITNELPSKSPLIELIERDDTLFYCCHSVSKESKISEILLPAKKVTLCATFQNDIPVILEWRLCVKSRLLSLLALRREKFIGYKVVVPFDQMP